MARAGSRGPFKEGRDDLEQYAAIHVTAKDVERIAEGTGQEILDWYQEDRKRLLGQTAAAGSPDLSPIPVLYISYDGTGVPIVPWEMVGRKGKRADGQAKTREVKLGCVFTQTTVDEEGLPVRDEASTTYVGAIETSEEFGWRMYAEALRRGMAWAEKVVVLADGAKYNWEIAALHFPHAIWIVDLYHARQHLHALCQGLALKEGKELLGLKTRWRTILDEGEVERIIQEAKDRLLPHGARHSESAQEAMKQIRYFENNIDRMRYADFRTQGLFVGSGVIEAGCKTIISLRLKQSGMEWTVRGANTIIALRCCYFSNRIEEFWEQHVG